MAVIKSDFDNQFVFWDYEKLSIVGVLGSLEKSLDSAILPLRQTGIEPANQVVKKDSKIVLGAFYLIPPIDITLCRKNSGETSILVRSLYRETSKEILNDIAKKVGLFKWRPVDSRHEEFIYDVDRGISSLIQPYEIAKNKTAPNDRKFCSTFGAILYSNFLGNYFCLRPREILKIAGEKFRVPSLISEGKA